ncbi:hypothetical protein BGX23_003573 [Mortierella sp. AD031]|nr:hypothetical protein BGX23_003573 [Mortierella sp. AD031]
MAARIRTCFPKVNSLVYKGEVFGVVPASLISTCLGDWKNIRIDATLDRTSCKALAEHCATLEVLQVTNILEDFSSTLRQIQSSSPKLRVLITSNGKFHVQPRIPYFEAEDFVDAHRSTLNPWACETSVKVLKTKITRIPRPDVTKLLDGRQRADALKETCTREGKQLQQCVYERLSRFINLEELCLGLDSKERRRRRLYPLRGGMGGEDYQYECLEMTLESGLDQLKALKNLRVLDVRMMAQRIGLKEVQWMTQNWLKLQVIQGLHDGGDNLEAAEWLWKHAPMITVEVSSRASIAQQL